MSTFYLTFPLRYKYDEHPSGQSISPDGWVEIEADSYDKARSTAFETFGSAWAFLYEKKDFTPELFPAGCMFTIHCQSVEDSNEIN